MAKKKKKNIWKKKIISLLIVFLISIFSIYEKQINETFGLPTSVPVFKETTSNLVVTYLDVGQADAILIQNQGDYMLIDAGNNEDGELLVKYFQNLGIQEFEYLIGTHPHEDHIGGLDNVIEAFDIHTIYLPDATTTTTTFLDVLEAMEQKNLTYKVPKIGEEFRLGEAEIRVIYTGTNTSDLNNTSIVLKLTFGSTSFLFTGDATSTTEKLILDQDIQADVLKIGHHGSKYSTTDKFLEKVNPKYAIISVGKNNSYKHPEDENLKKLEEKNIPIYRTDQKGSIFIQSDGTNIIITNKKTNTNGE